jgi:SWI/SNF-related matrix-associated actin-dependent regulator 1 of chromatin subfamily A
MIGPLNVILTPNCYKVSFTFHPMLLKCIQRIPSARWNMEEKYWQVSTTDYQYLQIMAQWAKKKGYITNVCGGKEEEPVIDYTIPEMPKLEVPHGMKIEPYDYQKEGIAYALKAKRCIFGDEPGLGKTAQAIGAVMIAKAWPCLVVCPAALKVNWQREFMKFGGLNAIILDDRNKATWQNFYSVKKPNGDALCNVFITNYESLKKFFVQGINDSVRFTMRAIHFDDRVKLFKSVIIDESHKCKSRKTQQSKFVQGIAKGKEYVFELTGTPVVNNNEDLIEQLTIMDRLEDFGGYRKFEERYCGGENKASHMRELNYYLTKICFFRRLKKDVLKQLPEKTRSYLIVDIDNMKEYRDAEKNLIDYLRNYRNADDEKIERAIRGQVMVQMSVLKQISAKGKIKSAADIIHNTIDGGDKLIVFCFLKQVVADLKKEFPDAVTVTGSDNEREKQLAVDSFQTKKDCRLIILNYRSGGVGLTLTAASNVLFVEFPWTYSDCCQAEDRAHRNGQKNAVNCNYLLGNGTIDEYMYNIIQTKKDIANEVTGTDDVVQEKRISQEQMMSFAMDMFKDKI